VRVETPSVARGESQLSDPRAAVAELANQIRQDDAAGYLVFCSDAYDPDALAAALNDSFQGPVVGCTTAGEIGSHYTTDGIVGIGFSRSDFRLHPVLIPDLTDFQLPMARQLNQELLSRLEFTIKLDGQMQFGLVLMDGLSIMEESIIAMVGTSLERVPVIGGSAGDNLHFRETRVFADGRFHTGAGIVTLFETRLPYHTFQLQHFEPSEQDLVITEADPSIRRVKEIDGGPAAEEYAGLLGLQAKDLTPREFSRHPLMLQIGEDWYVRSIQKANSDGSLDFFCAIEEGLPLTIARGVGLVTTLEARIDRLISEMGKIPCTLGCDCILRRLEMMEKGKTAAVEEQLARINFTGFSTFGEQYGPIHVNQTLTAVALGKR